MKLYAVASKEKIDIGYPNGKRKVVGKGVVFGGIPANSYAEAQAKMKNRLVTVVELFIVFGKNSVYEYGLQSFNEGQSKFYELVGERQYYDTEVGAKWVVSNPKFQRPFGGTQETILKNDLSDAISQQNGILKESPMMFTTGMVYRSNNGQIYWWVRDEKNSIAGWVNSKGVIVKKTFMEIVNNVAYSTVQVPAKAAGELVDKVQDTVKELADAAKTAWSVGKWIGAGLLAYGLYDKFIAKKK
jgi:hypothetical protein